MLVSSTDLGKANIFHLLALITSTIAIYSSVFIDVLTHNYAVIEALVYGTVRTIILIGYVGTCFLTSYIMNPQETSSYNDYGE